MTRGRAFDGSPTNHVSQSGEYDKHVTAKTRRSAQFLCQPVNHIRQTRTGCGKCRQKFATVRVAILSAVCIAIGVLRSFCRSAADRFAGRCRVMAPTLSVGFHCFNEGESTGAGRRMLPSPWEDSSLPRFGATCRKPLQNAVFRIPGYRHPTPVQTAAGPNLDPNPPRSRWMPQQCSHLRER